MCLYTKQKKPKIAEQDIVCYKRVIRTEYSDIFISEYKGFKYKIGKIYKKHFWNRVDIKLDCDNTFDNFYVINGGVFHSYMNEISFPFIREFATLECIIPKGTKYYEGIFETLCSRAIKIVKVL